jgi:hypothetical protein
LNTIHVGYMAAIWLVMEREPKWLDGLPALWWQRWAWYIVRELASGLMGEPESPKGVLLRRVHTRAPAEVRRELENLAMSPDPLARGMLTSLFGVFGAIEDATLDADLCAHLRAGRISDDRIGDVARFVLSRNAGRAVSTCLSLMDPVAVEKSESTAVSAAVVLLQTHTAEGWNNVFELLGRRPDLVQRVLGEFAHGAYSIESRDRTPLGPAKLPTHIGQLVSLLLQAFPPESDPKDDGRAHFLGPDDAARRLRDQLISALSDGKEIEAVEALKMLEQRFGDKYPWMRRWRARAERAYRLSCWTPIPPRAVAELLAARDKRLIRSGSDAVEGVIAAIEQYEYRLHHDSPSDLDDLWNRPRNVRPTPREEERVSDKLCTAIRDYFGDYAVGADREVQIYRRLLAGNLGGAPGSEVDVLCRVHAVGSSNGDAIAVPIEVKLSHNREARTGLRDQLVDRYMSELGTSFGVFVVVWMGMPKPPARYRPLWASPTAAQEELTQQAREASSSGLDVRAVVIDASLPVASQTTKSRKKAVKRARGANTATRPKAASATKKHTSVRSATGKKSSEVAKAKRKRSPKHTKR